MIQSPYLSLPKEETITGVTISVRTILTPCSSKFKAEPVKSLSAIRIVPLTFHPAERDQNQIEISGFDLLFPGMSFGVSKVYTNIDSAEKSRRSHPSERVQKVAADSETTSLSSASILSENNPFHSDRLKSMSLQNESFSGLIG